MDIGKLVREKEDDDRELQKKKKPLTLAQKIEAFLDGPMNANGADTLTRDHGEAIDKEIQRREQAERRKKEFDEKNALRIFNGVFTEKEEQAARQACWEVGQKHPTVLGIVENQLMLLAEVQGRKQFVTVPNLESAFRDLLARKSFIEVVEPVQSASDFLREHEELHDTRTPPLARAAVEKALLSFQHFRPEYIASSKNATLMMGWLSEAGLPPSVGNLEAAFDALRQSGQLELNTAVMVSGSTRFVDYGDAGPRGVPPRPDKAFRKKIEGMTSIEIAEACRLDPAFERALNNL